MTQRPPFEVPFEHVDFADLLGTLDRTEQRWGYKFPGNLRLDDGLYGGRVFITAHDSVTQQRRVYTVRVVAVTGQRGGLVQFPIGPMHRTEDVARDYAAALGRLCAGGMIPMELTFGDLRQIAAFVHSYMETP
jgi:hypothetical protein